MLSSLGNRPQKQFISSLKSGFLSSPGLCASNSTLGQCFQLSTWSYCLRFLQKNSMLPFFTVTTAKPKNNFLLLFLINNYDEKTPGRNGRYNYL
jgi:hypothetical protein